MRATSILSIIFIALSVGSASLVEGGAETMPGQVCANLSYDELSAGPGGFSTPAMVTFSPTGGASEYIKQMSQIQKLHESFNSKFQSLQAIHSPL